MIEGANRAASSIALLNCLKRQDLVYFPNNSSKFDYPQKQDLKSIKVALFDTDSRCFNTCKTRALYVFLHRTAF